MIIFGCPFLPVESGDGWKVKSKRNGLMGFILNYKQYRQHPKITKFYINICNKMLKYFLLSYFIYSQIWLNHLMDYYHMGYTKNLEEKKIKKKLWLIVGHLTNDIVSTQIFFDFFSKFFPDLGARLGVLFD